jgi:hypothetical protein
MGFRAMPRSEGTARTTASMLIRMYSMVSEPCPGLRGLQVTPLRIRRNGDDWFQSHAPV